MPSILKPKSIAELIIAKKAPGASAQEPDMDAMSSDNADQSADAGMDDSGIESAAADLKTALESNDVQGIAAALRSAFQILDSEPHDEGEHINEGGGEEEQQPEMGEGEEA